MKNEGKQSLRYPDIIVYADGKFFDSIQEKWLPVLFEHNTNYSGPVVYWSNNGRVSYLQASRLIYECFVIDDYLNPKWSIIPINGDENDIRPENLKKVVRNTVGHTYSKKLTEDQYSDWMGPDTVYM